MNIKPAVILAILSLAGCSNMSLPSLGSSSGPVAEVTLKPTTGNIAAGKVTFTQIGENKVRVEGSVSGLSVGTHGFHVHEKGDCSAPDATSAGLHFNPGGKPHGGTGGADRHGGDLGNLSSDNYGGATVKLDVEGLSTEPGKPNSVVGRALIVHADPDDLKTQPTGNSGKRVACGVIAAK